MRYAGGFLRKSSSGKWVGVLKYRDPAGQWRQVTKTFCADRAASEAMLAEWHRAMSGEGAPGAVGAAEGADLDKVPASAGGEGSIAASAGDGNSAATSAPAAATVGPGDTAAAPIRPALAPAPAGLAPASASALVPAPAGPASPYPAPAGGGPTVEEAVRALLSAQLARGSIERSTHDTQMAFAERDLFPQLGDERLAGLTPARVQAWCDALCARTSPASARIPYSVLGKALSRAERAGEITRSPMAAVEPPARARPARAWLPPDSVGLLGRAVASGWGPGHPFSCAVALALYAGLRAGECCGLRWRDVGEGCASVRVEAAVGRTRGGRYLKAPKSAASRRSFPVVPALSRALAARRSACGEPDGSWFVCGERGAMPDPRALSRAFAALCGEAGVRDSDGRRATFHELRHTFATEAVRAGVDARTLADMMGHAGADVTLNVYAASAGGAVAGAVGRLSADFGA